MIPNPRGWRRLWPSKLWLQTVEISPGVWNWKIWNAGKDRLLATGAESYTRQATAATGGVRFGTVEMKRLEEAESR